MSGGAGEYTCIVCPKSCRGRVEGNGADLSFSGYDCRQGEAYARNEHTCPKRILTTTVRIAGGRERRLPVVSRGEIERGKLAPCFARLHTLSVQAPVREGQIVAADIEGTGVDIIAAQDSD